ncbi:hypothetical protein E2562_032285 [Oryza meyeriana var. granulata]|uniref:Disease resistance N-terminal domain-containing protein n=1 Tax=Oryza meyeriana var. granulata TaxID=110450 RepID=A0A6G1F0J3_9ORYZ|nr:hypothetical protein E2562_032285 [Oryza meyeriana var. granulata]
MDVFLMHLTKTETEHDDQLRAWMMQIRDIAYIAEDCIQIYVRDLKPPESGFWASLRHLPVYIWTLPARHRLANKIRELKVRVHEVGERRLSYDVKVPEGVKPKPKPSPVTEDGNVNDRRDDFLRALEAKDDDQASAAASPSFSKAIEMLPSGLGSEAEAEIEAIRKKCVPNHVDSMKMLLRGLYACPYGTKRELEKLQNKLEERAADVPRR